MEKKVATKSYKDPLLSKLVQEKSQWNHEVSSLINDIIHFKKSMNGWPSKYYKERTRLTQPIPVDLSSILSRLASQFQDLAHQGTSIIQEQSNFAKNYTRRQSEKTLNKLEKKHGPEKPNLSKQLSQGTPLAANQTNNLIKLGISLESKYLEIHASNPVSRFMTRLFNPKFGFGEAARIRRLRMSMLDHCVKTYKAVKQLQKEIVKSSKDSIVNSHKMMQAIWNYWNIVNRLFSTYKNFKEDPDLQKEQALQEEPGQLPESQEITENNSSSIDKLLELVRDYKTASNSIKATGPNFAKLHSIVEAITAAPKDQKTDVLLSSDIVNVYNQALNEANAELETNGKSFKEIAKQMPTKVAQFKQLNKVRHQLLPGATSGSRLESYRLIDTVKKDLDQVMDLLEKGFDQEKLGEAIKQTHQEIMMLKTMIRSLYSSEKPEEIFNSFL